MLFRVSWISLTVIGTAILIFGLIVSLSPGPAYPLSLRAIGVASIGMGLFGTAIAAIPYRRRERWAWLSLWYYPVFWTVHLLAGLPPGQEHIHQIVFIVLSLTALLIGAPHFRS
jgi:uncharacterized membrane protein HdeD (DUF308 family)